MNQVTVPILRIHKDVVEEDQHKMPLVWLEDSVHQALKCGRDIGQAKGHDQEFIIPLVSAKGGLMDVRFMHPDLVVTRSQV